MQKCIVDNSQRLKCQVSPTGSGNGGGQRKKGGRLDSSGGCLSKSNQGTAPIFERPHTGSSSIIDLTLATDELATRIQNWRVDAETLSDHKYLTYDITTEVDTQTAAPPRNYWQLNTLDAP